MSLLQSLSSSRRLLERRLGLAIRRFPVVDSHAAELKAMFIGLALDGAVDVGGHHGEFAEFLRRDVGYAGTIVSFEPSPEAFAELKAASSTDPDWQVHDLAIGSEAGRTELNVYSNTFLNSFHHLSAISQTKFAGVEPVSSVTAEVNRLDRLYEPSWGTRLLLKSDTQGNDLAVIESAEGIMDRVHGIQVEAGVVPIYDHVPSLSDTIERLSSLGFGASSFHPIGRQDDSRAAIEFDITFVRR